MRPARVVALILGCLLFIPAIAMLLAGGALGVGYAVGRDDDGFFAVTLERLSTDAVAITAGDLTLTVDPGSPDWLLDLLDADVRIRATSAAADGEIFVGIGPLADIADYLTGVAHAEVVEVDRARSAVLRERVGSDVVAAPATQTFWAATATGPGTQELQWEATAGSWAVVVMNADAAPGVAVDVNVGAKAAFVVPLAWLLLGVGVALTTIAVVLIVVGAQTRPAPSSTAPAAAPIPLTAPPGTAPLTGPPSAPSSTPPLAPAAPAPVHPVAAVHPVTLSARLDPELSRWMWLVKWVLAIPHFIVLAFLWLAFVVLTLVAAVAIIVTGRYPRGIFEFNVGVLRWSWRVSYYATAGGVGTDSYPPFSLHPEPGDPAQLEITYPEQLSRGLVVVKWLLAIPHLVIVAVLAGSSVHWMADGRRVGVDVLGGGLLGILVLIAALTLLFTSRYPRALFDLIIGLNRWIYRTIAYVALLTDTYPPFRLDQGGDEPHP